MVRMTILPRWKACVSSWRMWCWMYLFLSRNTCWWLPPAARLWRLFTCSRWLQVWWGVVLESNFSNATRFSWMSVALTSSKHSLSITSMSDSGFLSQLVLLRRTGNRSNSTAFVCSSICCFSCNSSVVVDKVKLYLIMGTACKHPRTFEILIMI